MSSSVKHTSGKPVSLVWLRRDLRLYDHSALGAAARGEQPVQPIFVFDTDILARFKHKADRRVTFIAQALCRMHEQLEGKGSGLLIFHGPAEKIVPEICAALDCRTLFAAEDFEPATRRRDASVGRALSDSTAFVRIKDHLLVAPGELLKSDGTPYKVFTPYARAWRELARSTSGFAYEVALKNLKMADYQELRTRLGGKFTLLDPIKGPEALLEQIGYSFSAHDWPVIQARKRLHAFAEERMRSYKTQRDFMASYGTSRLSPYLRFGLLSVRECARLAFEEESRGNTGATTWINELIWRDFYAMILYHFPETETKEMQVQYRSLTWSYDESLFKRFTEGKTGYPIIDAAMRELTSTGYMHNRARMIVASFMTKDLLIDWRMGEEHFAQYLMDYELSSNVGGWQWAASTGTDAQPYFRVFNPVLQSKRFDPDGDYIRRFVPELAHLEGDNIYEPWKDAMPKNYPKPIVDHAKARAKAIALFKNAGAA